MSLDGLFLRVESDEKPLNSFVRYGEFKVLTS
jgi:hypothetical protein